jgi:hypothetical protein
MLKAVQEGASAPAVIDFCIREIFPNLPGYEEAAASRFRHERGYLVQLLSDRLRKTRKK